MVKVLPLGLLVIGTAALASSSAVSSLAGRYTHRFKNGNIDGDVYYTTDVVEILPIDAGSAVINMELNFFNGHSCSVSGIAKLDRDRLIYREQDPNPWSDGGCRLEIWRDRTKLRWTEGEGTSCQNHCGARGGLSVGDIPYGSRRKISPVRAKLMRENPDALVEH